MRVRDNAFQVFPTNLVKFFRYYKPYRRQVLYGHIEYFPLLTRIKTNIKVKAM